MITDTRAVIGGQTVELSEVDSVSLTSPVLNRGWGFAMIGLGIVLAVVGYFVWSGTFLTPMLGGVALIVIGTVLAFAVRPRYIVRINQRDGQVLQLPFPTRRQAADVVSSISAGVARR